MRAMQYNRCGVLQQESVWCVLQSKKCDHLMGFISHLHSYVRAFCISSGIAVFVILPNPAKAEPPVLELPIDCQLGSTCWLVNHVDRAPGPGIQDYRCGPLSYNIHQGTDIAIANKRIMDAGVPVLAAASGTVIDLRDGMPKTTREALQARTSFRGRQCGNKVTILHNDNWSTKYCHLKAGTIRVQLGDRVQAGDRLGEVGMSGMTSFPHIHLTVYDGKTVIDPFTNTSQIATCNPLAEPKGLWSESARQALTYPGPQLYHTGFHDAPVKADDIRAGKLTKRNFSPSSPLLLFWSEIFTLEKNDLIVMSLIAPDGTILKTNRSRAGETLARASFFVKKDRPSGGWNVGIYAGHVEVHRGQSVISTKATASVR